MGLYFHPYFRDILRTSSPYTQSYVGVSLGRRAYIVELSSISTTCGLYYNHLRFLTPLIHNGESLPNLCKFYTSWLTCVASPIALKPSSQVHTPWQSDISVNRGVFWYRGRDSNPHGPFGPKDFKSFVSTIPPPRRLFQRTIQRYESIFTLTNLFFCSRGGNWTHDLDCIRILLSPTELPDYVSPLWDSKWVDISVFFLSINLRVIPLKISQHYWEEVCRSPLFPRCPTRAVDILRTYC